MPSSPKILLRRLTWTLWALALIMAVLVFAMRNRQASPAADLPELLDAPDFTLINRDGKSVSLDHLAGKPWVVDFIFTRCPGVCPIMTQRMKELVTDMPEGTARYVSISVDPEYDSPEVLAAYGEKYGAGPDWYFLTGTQDQIYPLIREGFLLALDPDPDPHGSSETASEPIVHSNRFVLVDSVGKIRGYYNSYNAEELANLRRDLLRLAR